MYDKYGNIIYARRNLHVGKDALFWEGGGKGAFAGLLIGSCIIS